MFSFTVPSPSDLCLLMKVSVVADSVNISGQSNAVQFKVPECRLADDLGLLFENQRFSDVTLCVNGRDFQVSQCFLFCFFLIIIWWRNVMLNVVMFFNPGPQSDFGSKESSICRHVWARNGRKKAQSRRGEISFENTFSLKKKKEKKKQSLKLNVNFID